jgi:hypothetical protein
MDIFRLANDSLGVFNNRNERGKKSCSGHSDSTFGQITDSAVLSGKFGSRVPSYKAGPALPLPYSGTTLPQQSRFGNFFWNHLPPFVGSVFDGSRRANTGSVPQKIRFVMPEEMPRPVQRKAAPPVRNVIRKTPRGRSTSQAFARTAEPKPDIFATASAVRPQASSMDWANLWQN